MVFFQIQACSLHLCNHGSVNVLIRKVLTEHAGVLAPLRGSFGAPRCDMFVANRLSQSTTPGQQRRSAAVTSKWSPHLFTSMLALLPVALQAELETSWTGYRFAAPKLKQRYLPCRFTNKGDPTRGGGGRAGQTGQLCAKVPFKENVLITSYPTSPPPQFFLLPQQWQWQIAVQNRIYSISTGHTETRACSKSSFV